ncbi:MAG: polyphosphate polymerase domain-containing protein [Bacteroidota bacterium]
MRFERKYRVEGRSLASVEQLLRFHPASFQVLYPPRQINNIYFDTQNLATFHQNIAGQNERKKFRVRWYGETSGPIQQPQFEIKIKHNELGTKETSQLAKFDLQDLKETTQAVNQLLPQRQGVVIPALLNAYRRSYWISMDGQFRVTIDHAMRYHSLLMGQGFHRFLHQDPAIILEVKYEQITDERVNFITQHMPFRQAKHSKYVQGVLMTIQG